MLTASNAACGEQLLVISVLHSSDHLAAQASYSICLRKELEEEENRGNNTCSPRSLETKDSKEEWEGRKAFKGQAFLHFIFL